MKIFPWHEKILSAVGQRHHFPTCRWARHVRETCRHNRVTFLPAGGKSTVLTPGPLATSTAFTLTCRAGKRGGATEIKGDSMYAPRALLVLTFITSPLVSGLLVVPRPCVWLRGSHATPTSPSRSPMRPPSSSGTRRQRRHGISSVARPPSAPVPTTSALHRCPPQTQPDPGRGG